jgi:geranylgeranyl pyrophosphate synthase
METKTTQKLIKQLKKMEASLGQERDALQDLIYDAEGLKEASEQAYEYIQSAIAELSSLV